MASRNTWQLLLVLLINLLIGAVMAQENYYELLRITQEADSAAVKKAFRKMSIEYHPDKNPGDEDAAEKFTKISRAYEVLTDELKRQIYDQQGEAGVEQFERGGEVDNRRKGPQNKLQLQVTLEQLYNGAQMEFNVNRNIYCDKCKGSGAEGGKQKQCPTCKGRGQVTVVQNMGFMQMQVQQPCGKCNGKGRVHEKDCPTCKGKKVVKDSKKITVDVIKGMANQEKILYEKQGEQVPDMIQGDILVVLQQQKHNLFKRVQNNLYMNIDVSLQEALFGYERNMAHLDGHQFDVNSVFNKVTQPFSWNIVRGEGMPIKDSGDMFGDLHAKLMVQFPKSLTKRQKELVALIFPDE